MAKRLKVPKKIAGIRIPQSVRKRPVGAFVKSTAGQLLIAEALLLAGESIAASSRSAARAADQGPDDQPIGAGGVFVDGSQQGGDAETEAAARLSQAFTDALRAFRSALGEVTAPDREQGAEHAATNQ